VERFVMWRLSRVCLVPKERYKACGAGLLYSFVESKRWDLVFVKNDLETLHVSAGCGCGCVLDSNTLTEKMLKRESVEDDGLHHYYHQ
jgi:hypothetical protein